MVKKCSLGKALFKNIGSPLILIKAKAKFNQNLRRSIHYELFLKQSQKKVGKIKGDLPGARSQEPGDYPECQVPGHGACSGIDGR